MRCQILCALIWTVTANLYNFNNQPDGLSNETFYDKRVKDRKYKPEWSDLDTRPLPEWYDRAKVGIFLHWGVYSVPAYVSEWFWEYWILEGNKRIKTFMKRNYPRGFTYQQFAPMFTAEFFDPGEWAKLFKKAGAKYVVLTSKYHDGYTLFPSNQSFSWNSIDVGPHRDLAGDLSKAVESEGLKFGLYYSLYEWFNPIYMNDRRAEFKTFNYRDQKVFPDMKQIIYDYKPSIFWSDGDGEAVDTYWNSTNFLAWLYNDSPVKDRIVVNDRWGIGTSCKHGDFYNCENKYDPGNVLINVGPTKEGTIPPIFQERLLDLGEWLYVNGEAIYSSSPWLHQNDKINSDVWYTCKKRKYNARQPTAIPGKADELEAIYAIFLTWPRDSVLKLNAIAFELNQTINHIELLGLQMQYITWSVQDNEAIIELPNKALVKTNYAWTLKFF